MTERISDLRKISQQQRAIVMSFNHYEQKEKTVLGTKSGLWTDQMMFARS
jgi:hypothetical protein